MGIAAEEITVDIMDVQINHWVAVTYENNLFPDIAFDVQSINSAHSILNYSPHLFNGDRPSLKLVRKGEEKFVQPVGDEGGNRFNGSYGRSILRIYQYSC